MCICWDLLKEKNVYADMAHFICLNIVTQNMFVESAHLYVLKNTMAGIYWLVELGPMALAEIISVCKKNHITCWLSQKDDRLQILHFQCYDCWWTGVTCGLIAVGKKKKMYNFIWMRFAFLYSFLIFETICL